MEATVDKFLKLFSGVSGVGGVVLFLIGFTVCAGISPNGICIDPQGFLPAGWQNMPVSELRAALGAYGIGLEVLAGGSYALSRAFHK